MSSQQAERFRHIYDQTSRRVFAYLRRHCGLEDAKTVLSEVYLKAWRHIDELDDEPMGWLVVTARRCLVDLHRASARNANLARDYLSLHREHLHAGGAETTALERGLMVDALRSLSADDREVLLLVGWEGLDNRQLAEVLGCSVPAAATRLSRARARLESLLEDRPVLLRKA